MTQKKKIFEALKAGEQNDLSIKDNMIRYCIEIEKMNEEEAKKTVDEIVKGVSEFTKSFDNIKGKSRDEISASFKGRLNEKLKDLPEEDVNKIIRNLLVQLSTLSIESMEKIAEDVKDEELKARINEIRRQCKIDLSGKTYDEKLAILHDAIDNCGSLRALVTLSTDEKSFSSATTLDDAVSTAALNGTEDSYIIDEIELLRIKNYQALAAYISARHGENRDFNSETSAYEVGVATAASVEGGRIRAAAIKGMITFDNAVALLGKIAIAALACFILYKAITYLPFLVIRSLFVAHPVLDLFGTAAFIYFVFNGSKFLFENSNKLGTAVSKPVIGIKNLAVRLIKKFCQIFKIGKAKNEAGAVYDEEEEEEEETVVSEETAVDSGEKTHSNPNVTLATN